MHHLFKSYCGFDEKGEFFLYYRYYYRWSFIRKGLGAAYALGLFLEYLKWTMDIVNALPGLILSTYPHCISANGVPILKMLSL